MLNNVSNEETCYDTYRLGDPGHKKITSRAEDLVDVEDLGVIKLGELVYNCHKGKDAEWAQKITQDFLHNRHRRGFYFTAHNRLVKQTARKESFVFHYYFSYFIYVIRNAL